MRIQTYTPERPLARQSRAAMDDENELFDRTLARQSKAVIDDKNKPVDRPVALKPKANTGDTANENGLSARTMQLKSVAGEAAVDHDRYGRVLPTLGAAHRAALAALMKDIMKVFNTRHFFITNKFKEPDNNINTQKLSFIQKKLGKMLVKIQDNMSQLAEDNIKYNEKVRRSKIENERNENKAYLYHKADQIITVAQPATGQDQATTIKAITAQTRNIQGATAKIAAVKETSLQAILMKVSNTRNVSQIKTAADNNSADTQKLSVIGNKPDKTLVTVEEKSDKSEYDFAQKQSYIYDNAYRMSIANRLNIPTPDELTNKSDLIAQEEGQRSKLDLIAQEERQRNLNRRAYIHERLSQMLSKIRRDTPEAPDEDVDQVDYNENSRANNNRLIQRQYYDLDKISHTFTATRMANIRQEEAQETKNNNRLLSARG